MSETGMDLETRIRQRAYSLWEEDGRPNGRAEEYWERARKLIEAEDSPNSPDMTNPPPF
jgi:hypothetical protein